MHRMFVESYATDSFQNVLFPLLFFPTFANSIPESRSSSPPLQQALIYPCHLTIISHAFKRYRFIALHLPALRYPVTPDRISYIGIDPSMDEIKRADVRAGELSNGVRAWERDCYGVGEALKGKRQTRGWTEEREQRFWREVTNAGDTFVKKDVMTFLEWLRKQLEERHTYPGTFAWT
jgi:hypothetical protein